VAHPHAAEQPFSRGGGDVRPDRPPDDDGDEERRERADAGEQEWVVARRGGGQRRDFDGLVDPGGDRPPGQLDDEREQREGCTRLQPAP